jgi:hypothetical protein
VRLASDAQMPRWPVRILVLVLLISVVALVFETKRLAVVAGTAQLAAYRLEQRAGQAEQPHLQADGAQADKPPASAALPKAPVAAAPSAVPLDDFTRLQVELHSTRQQLAAVTKLLEQRNAEAEQRARLAAEAAAKSQRPMPAGVRLCLDTLHECLRIEGYTSHRFLRAVSLDQEGLHEVEMLEASPDGLSVAFVTAQRMTAMVDRATGRLELRFFDGHRAVDGDRAALPEDGLVITFDEIDARLFAERLPYLVQCEGSYPEVQDERSGLATDVDAGTQRQWLARLTQLLDKAETKLLWRVSRFRGMSDGHFLTVELLGTNDKHMLLGSCHCARMAVEIDEQVGVVSLLLQGGVLQRDGRESTITEEGYRMLLPGLTTNEAIDAMLGMIVRK